MKNVNDLQPHEVRVVKECAEVKERRDALGAFVAGAVYRDLPEDERRRLDRQHTYMTLYVNVLMERINAF